MHELGIAQGILEIIQQYVSGEQAGAVRAVRVRVGQISGVLPESLEFCFAAIVAETALHSARLEIERVPAAAHCKRCSAEFAIEDLAFACPACGNPEVSVTSGSELQVVEIELDDAPAEVP